MANVSLKGIRRSFGSAVVIEHLDLDLAAGECQIGDRVVNRLAPRDRSIAMVFQNYAPYPHKTVA